MRACVRTAGAHARIFRKDFLPFSTLSLDCRFSPLGACTLKPLNNKNELDIWENIYILKNKDQAMNFDIPTADISMKKFIFQTAEGRTSSRGTGWKWEEILPKYVPTNNSLVMYYSPWGTTWDKIFKRDRKRSDPLARTAAIMVLKALVLPPPVCLWQLVALCSIP